MGPLIKSSESSDPLKFVYRDDLTWAEINGNVEVIGNYGPLLK